RICRIFSSNSYSILGFRIKRPVQRTFPLTEHRIGILVDLDMTLAQHYEQRARPSRFRYHKGLLWLPLFYKQPHVLSVIAHVFSAIIRATFIHSSQKRRAFVQGAQGLAIQRGGFVQPILSIERTCQISQCRGAIDTSWVFFFDDLQGLPVQFLGLSEVVLLAKHRRQTDEEFRSVRIRSISLDDHSQCAAVILFRLRYIAANSRDFP